MRPATLRLFNAVLASLVWLACGSTASAPESAVAGNLRLGGPLPGFALEDLDGGTHHLADLFDGQHFVAVVWHAPTCPCAVTCADAVAREMPADKYPDLRILAVVSNAMWNYDWFQADLRKQIAAGTLPYPVVIDRDGAVARLYGAERTPTVYLADKQGRLRFWGAAESSLEPADPAYRFLFKDAVDALRAGREPEPARFEPFGCLISRETSDRRGS